MAFREFRVTVDRKRCGNPMTCRVCLECCPQSVFTTYPKGGRRRRDVKSTWVIHPGFAALCDGCNICVQSCPRDAITVTPRRQRSRDSVPA